MRRVFYVLVLTLTFFIPNLHARETATSFCKCICFNNSTIIALNPRPSTSPPPSSRNAQLLPRSSEEDNKSGPQPPHHHTPLTCASCNRAFCLDYNLPICKDAREEDVFTTCFQRDSLKDETVVVLFLFLTSGLLGWALIKPFVEKLKQKNTTYGLPQTMGRGGGNENVPGRGNREGPVQQQQGGRRENRRESRPAGLNT